MDLLHILSECDLSANSRSISSPNPDIIITIIVTSLPIPTCPSLLRLRTYLLFPVFITLLGQCLCDDWSAPCNKTRCTCKWMSGKKSALCNSADHDRVPTTLSTDLQVLSLNENNVTYLNREEFYRNGLEHLQRIFVKGSHVQFVHRDAFKNLKILVEIDLSDNLIASLEPDTFAGNDRLRVLYLYGNPLTRLLANQFPVLPHLRTLDMHDCLIRDVDEAALRKLDQLEYLSLKNNSIARVGERTFANLKALKTLLLEDNPWSCDCQLRQFRNWYVRTNYKKLTCRHPARLADKHWDAVEEIQFGCLPHVELIADHHNVIHGQNGGEDLVAGAAITNVSFHCLVQGDPRPQVTWELNANPLPDGYNVVVSNTEELVEAGVGGGDDSTQPAVMWSNLTILNVTNYDSGTYTCRAWNLIGEAGQNATLFLPEVVEHVIVKTHETFWYFGLIIGTFGTIFSLIFISVTICYCRKAAHQRRVRRNHKMKMMGARGGGAGSGSGDSSRGGRRGTGKGANGTGPGHGLMKGSISFNDQEKRLLDLSLTNTTNERGDSCELVNTPSTTITLNNSLSLGATTTYSAAAPHKDSAMIMEQHQMQQQQQTPPPGSAASSLQITIENPNRSDEFPLHVGLFPPPPAEFSCAMNNNNSINNSISINNHHNTSNNSSNNSGNYSSMPPPHIYTSSVVGHHHPSQQQQQHQALTSQDSYQYHQQPQQLSQQHYHHRYPAAVAHPNPGYGNIFISVSVTQDGLDSPDLNMYPDLLNIPSRMKTSNGGGGSGGGSDGAHHQHQTSEGIVNAGNSINATAICNSITNNQNNNIIIVNGADCASQTTASGENPAFKQRGYGQESQSMLTGASVMGVGGISTLLSPPLAPATAAAQNQCAFATLPRHTRLHHPGIHPQYHHHPIGIFTASNQAGGMATTGGTSTCLVSPSTTVSSSASSSTGGGGQMSPIVITNNNSNNNHNNNTSNNNVKNNSNCNNLSSSSICNAAIKLMGPTPATIHEHDVINYHNLETPTKLYNPRRVNGIVLTDLVRHNSAATNNGGSGSTSSNSGSHLYHPHGSATGSPKLYVDDECHIAVQQQQQCCPKYDNIGRRITASGNSAIKLPEDDENDMVIQYGVQVTAPLHEPGCVAVNGAAQHSMSQQQKAKQTKSKKENESQTATSTDHENDSHGSGVDGSGGGSGCAGVSSSGNSISNKVSSDFVQL